MFRSLALLLLLTACTPTAVDNPARAAVLAVPDPAPPQPSSVPSVPVPDPVPVPTPPVLPPAEGAIVLALGEQAQIAPKTTLRYDKLVSDSRCPAGVQCVWAGEVRIALSLAGAGGSESFELSEREHSATVQGFAIELLAYGPCPLGHGAPKQECAALKSTPPK